MYPELRSTAFSFARQGGREALFSRSGFVLPIDHHVFADGRRVALCFVVAPCLDSTLCGRNGGVVLSRRLLRRRPSRQPAHATCGGVDRSHNRNPFFIGEPGITAISSFGHLTREVAKRRGRRASLASALFEDRPRPLGVETRQHL